MLRLTRAQVREVDRRAIEDLHIPGIVLMENAACSASDAARDMLSGDCIGQVLILCGGGNNGGDGLAIARHLHNRGCRVQILLAVEPARYKGDALINWEIARVMKLKVIYATPDVMDPDAAMLIDAIFGTGLSKPIEGAARDVIDAINKSGRPVLAIDLPSGLDCDTGEPLGAACVRATRTVTFVAEKVGFANPAARAYTGEVIVADIGCPSQVIEEVLRDLPG